MRLSMSSSIAAVGIDVVPDQRGDGVPVAWREPIGPMGLGENLLEHERVDVDHAVLQQVQASMLTSWSSQPVAGDSPPRPKNMKSLALFQCSMTFSPS